MIAQLRGQLVYKGDDLVVIEVGGIGWEAYVPSSTREQLPALGQPVHLFTHLHVREDALQLYAFMTMADREVFRKLLTVSGIGPRLALAMLSALPGQALQQAIAQGDIGLLTHVPGVGKKTAQRLALELRGKLDLDLALTEVAVGSEEVPSASADTLAALQELGYSRAEAFTALKQASTKLKEAGQAEPQVADLLRAALGELNRRQE